MKLRSIILVLALLAFMVTIIGGYLYYTSLRDFSISESHRKAEARLKKSTSYISSFLIANRKAVKSLAGLRESKQIFDNYTPDNLVRLNEVLDLFAESFQVEVCYLLNAYGVTIASSNRHEPDSFVGNDYSFRPYYKEAIQGNFSTYMALGVTSNRRGIYFSIPIYSVDNGSINGVAVVKLSVDYIDNELIQIDEGILSLVETRGVIFSSNNKDWLYQLLWKATPETISSISESRQFGSGPWEFVGITIENNNKAFDDQGNKYIIHESEINQLPGWKIIYLHDLQIISSKVSMPLNRTVGFLVLLTSIVTGAAIVFLLYKANHEIQARKRTETELDNYREQLEEKVQKRTDELSSANEELKKEIAERELAEKYLRDSEEKYRDIFENATDLIQVIKPNGKLLYVNESWKKTLKYSDTDISELTLFDLIPKNHKKNCMDAFQNIKDANRSYPIETIMLSKDGKMISVAGNANVKFEEGRPAYVRCILRDVTEEKGIREELQRTQKLESLGVLAGGIAHDFNNLLTAILGNVSLAKLFATDNEKIQERLKTAEEATYRAKDLTKQLLTFSKGGTPIKNVTSIEGLIRDTCKFVLRGSSVICNYEFPEDCWPVEVDEGQLAQVIHNLILNASQSMPNGGNVYISCRNFNKDGGDVLPFKDGKYIVVSIRDEGEGITQENLAKIFDPYFSTKKSGSGLGLAVAYSIVINHDGHILAESKVGEGTSFHIFLPASSKELLPVDTKEDVDFIKGTGKILVVDDEEIVREIATGMLEYCGYEVESAWDGGEALKIFEKAKADGKPFDAVVLDLTIPGGMGGKDAIKQLLAVDADATVIVSSGYANDPIMSDYESYGFVGVAPKPYKIEDMSRIIQKALTEKNVKSN